MKNRGKSVFYFEVMNSSATSMCPI